MKMLLLAGLVYYLMYRFILFLLDQWSVKNEAKQIKETTTRKKAIIRHL